MPGPSGRDRDSEGFPGRADGPVTRKARASMVRRGYRYGAVTGSQTSAAYASDKLVTGPPIEPYGQPEVRQSSRVSAVDDKFSIHQ